jgi:hypothetical protein
VTRLNVLSSSHGSVHVYTRRHINGCTRVDPNDNRCSCPKWIYSKARGGKPSQRAARTPSFIEACSIARKILEGFDREPGTPSEQQPQPQPGRLRGRPIEQITEARITLVGCLRIEGVKPYSMKNDLYPGRDDRDLQYDALKKFLQRHRQQIALEEQRLTALPQAARDAAASDARRFIHFILRLP